MKLYTTLLLAALAGVLAYAARRRLKLAFTVAAVAYLVILPVRLLFASGDLGDRADELAPIVLGVLVVWAALWRFSVWYAHRKRLRHPVPPGRRGSRLRRFRQ